MFGVAIGNAMGLLIGIVFIPGNLGIGLLIGNILGCVGGLLLGIIISKIMVRENRIISLKYNLLYATSKLLE